MAGCVEECVTETVRTIRAEICVLGAGPAGVGAALELSRAGVSDVVVVDRNTRAGGLARTDVFNGHRFDVGPHRFFTPNREVDALWREVLGGDFRPVRRLTRIFYRDEFFLYPVSALDALPKLGAVQAAHALLSYLYAAVARDAGKAGTFAEWVSAKFGTKLYESFFKTYTEKVWGIPCSEIGADWASQRIKGLDLTEVIKNAFGLALGNRPKTLADEFDYPSMGAGMMYERMAERAAESGVDFLFDVEVRALERRGDRVRAVLVEGPDGQVRIESREFISTLPLTRFLTMLRPAPGPEVLEACEALYYRDHITVNLVIDRDELFDDQWIYVHAPDVQMARLVNYNNFSDRMAGLPGTTPVSAEYFVFRTDELWKMEDADLVDLARDEIERMGLIPKGSAQQGWVVRETDSYPTYYLGYEAPYERVKKAVDSLANVHPAGRGGLYKYNNMDHSLYSGMLAARNLTSPRGERYDVWRINIDAEYQEGARRPI